mmetsp:Transcript_135505/g.420964  ORF Transcript_135505/g.420964 Transcript_135505/m.420964 type:complete len:231 (+) Transcript_135505:168-860(+)
MGLCNTPVNTPPLPTSSPQISCPGEARNEKLGTARPPRSPRVTERSREVTSISHSARRPSPGAPARPRSSRTLSPVSNDSSPVAALAPESSASPPRRNHRTPASSSQRTVAPPWALRVGAAPPHAGGSCAGRPPLGDAAGPLRPHAGPSSPGRRASDLCSERARRTFSARLNGKSQAPQTGNSSNSEAPSEQMSPAGMASSSEAPGPLPASRSIGRYGGAAGTSGDVGHA